MTHRGVEPVGWRGWRAIDAAERNRGAEASRPRVKFIDVAEMVAAAKGDWTTQRRSWQWHCG
jgi:ferredoxin--NADP+ reductase